MRYRSGRACVPSGGSAPDATIGEQNDAPYSLSFSAAADSCGKICSLPRRSRRRVVYSGDRRPRLRPRRPPLLLDEFAIPPYRNPTNQEGRGLPSETAVLPRPGIHLHVPCGNRGGAPNPSRRPLGGASSNLPTRFACKLRRSSRRSNIGNERAESRSASLRENKRRASVAKYITLPGNVYSVVQGSPRSAASMRGSDRIFSAERRRSSFSSYHCESNFAPARISRATTS